MTLLYLLALVPAIIGLLLFWKNKKYTIEEWLITSASAFILAIIFHLISLGVIHNLTKDIQTYSGYIQQGIFIPEWQEYYEEAIYRTEYYQDTEYYTDSKGRSQSRTVTKSRQVFDHWEPRTRIHHENYTFYSSIDTSYSVTKEKYYYLVEKFGNEKPAPGRRRTGEHNSRMISGDPNDYVTSFNNIWYEPVTKLGSFENKIKASPNIFKFSKVPTNINVFSWPENNNWNYSERTMGIAKTKINPFKVDQLNAKLGSIKKVNIIICGFGARDASYGEYQQAAWLGGKKNDLVICYGGEDKATWVKVFSWSESEICKRNLETIFLQNPINDDILELVEKEVLKNFKIKDWTKFDYLKIDPPDWVYYTYIIVLIIVIATLFIIFGFNTLDQGSETKKVNKYHYGYGYKTWKDKIFDFGPGLKKYKKNLYR